MSSIDQGGLGLTQTQCSESAALSTARAWPCQLKLPSPMHRFPRNPDNPQNPHISPRAADFKEKPSNCPPIPATSNSSNKRERGTQKIWPEGAGTPSGLVLVRIKVLEPCPILAAEKLSQSGQGQSNGPPVRLCRQLLRRRAEPLPLLGIQETGAMPNKSISPSETATCLNKAGRPTSESSVRRLGEVERLNRAAVPGSGDLQ